MKGLLRAFVLGALVLWPGSLPADQNDPRLDELFAELRQASSLEAAQAVEGRIWAAWLRTGDDAVEILMRNGIEAMQRGDVQTALRAFDQVVAIAPDYAEGWNKRATLYYLMGRYEDSLADIEKTLDLEPRHFGALSGRGLVYARLEEPEMALRSFEEALEIHPMLPGAKRNAEQLRESLERHRI